MTEHPRRYIIESPGIPPTLNDRLHWAARHRITAPQRDYVAWQCKAFGLQSPIPHARVTCTLFRTNGRAKDIGGAYEAVKCLVDGLVLGGILTDDDPAHMDLLVVQERGPTRCVRLVVEEVG